MSAAGIDLWWFPLDPQGERCGERAVALLGTAERMRLRQFDRPGAAGLFALRRAVRRVILADYLDCRPDAIGFDEPPGAKPRVENPAEGCEFSASDTVGLGVLAVAQGEAVGADAEAMRPVDAAGFVRRILTPAEKVLLREIPGEHGQQLMLLRAWTAKEAVLKGIGTGLDLAAMRQIGVGKAQGQGAWHPVSPEIQGGPGHGWNVWFQNLQCAGGTPVIAAVACRSPQPVEVRSAAALMDRYGLR